MRYKMKGFSLIELLIVLAIMLILTSIAYPLYTQHVARAKAKNAKAALMLFATRMESYHHTYSSYKGASCMRLNVRCTAKDKSYRFKVQLATNHTFELEAIPIKKACGLIRLNSQGEFKENECTYTQSV